MARFLLAFLVWVGGLVLAGGAAASPCPAPQPGGNRISATGVRLAAAHHAQVVAGGALVLASCEEPTGEGKVAPAPNVTLMLAEGGDRPLEFRTEGDCDTVLVVATEAGAWHYDDDGGSEGGARVRIEAAADGRYDVWVGTYGEGSCRARLVLQTPT